MQDSFTDYLLCVSSDECVAGHNDKITHKNCHPILCDFHDREARLLQKQEKSRQRGVNNSIGQDLCYNNNL